MIYGRSDMCDVRVADPSVSSRHAQLSVSDGIWQIEDLGSSNGTFVNGVRITQASIYEDDLIHLGSSPFRFYGGRLVPGVEADFSITTAHTDVVPPSPSGMSRKLAAISAFSVIVAIGAWWIMGRSSGMSQKDAEFATVLVIASNSSGEACWTGSGAIVGNGNYVLTNAHVALPGSAASLDESQCTKLKIGYTEDSSVAPTTFRAATVQESSEELDLAILKIDQPKSRVPFFKPKTKPLDIASNIRVLGYPGMGGDSLTVTAGVVSGADKSEGVKYIKISASIASGNSGGPVIDSDGRLVGIATASIRATVDCETDGNCYSAGQSIGLARPIELAMNWLKGL